MKKTFILLALLPAMLSAQTDWKNLKITPAKPRPGETIAIEYNWSNGPLAKAGEIEIVALEFAGDEPVGKDVFLQNTDNKLTGSFASSANAATVLVCLRGDEKWDNNNGAGYFIPLHDAAGMPLPESKAAQAVMSRS